MFYSLYTASFISDVFAEDSKAGSRMKARKSNAFLSVTLTCLILLGSPCRMIEKAGAAENPEGPIPIKWAVIVMGGYNYYRDLTYNAIQRIEKIMMGRGVPYDLFQDDAIVAPIDSPPSGKYALQYTNGTPRYQVLVLLMDYEPSDDTGVNQNYIYWAVGNGTNIVLFNKVIRAVPALLRLARSDISWDWSVVTTSHTVYRTFNDGIREYIAGSAVTLGATLQFHTVFHKYDGMTVWFTKTWGSSWSVGMVNTTYGAGNVWYLGYSLNEVRMDDGASKYPVMWSDNKMEFWGHSINFALNSVEKIYVSIMPYKRWKGAWVIRIDTDAHAWKDKFLPPESVLQAGWVYDYQFCVLGYTRITGTADLPLISGIPSGYSGIPSRKIMSTDVTGVLQTDLVNAKTYKAIIFNSTNGGNYDRIKLDFNENKNFADDIEYKIWQNMTYPTVQGKLYWSKVTPNFVNPVSINVGWWQTPMLMENEATSLPLWKQYGHDYGLSYSFHGWQHVALEGGSTYPMWDGTRFVLNPTYIEEKFEAARYWMKDMFGGTGYGFEEDQVMISHPFDSHMPEVDSAIDSLPWVISQYPGQMYYIGFGKQSATSKYTLSSSRQEDFYTYSSFSAIQDIVRTLYPVISTLTHFLGYNPSFSFPQYSNSIKPANPQDALAFWVNAKHMLENTPVAYYKQDRIVLEFEAQSGLTDFVWKFPVNYNGRQFSTFYDSTSTGQIKHNDGTYVYIEFGQGQGVQRLEAIYGPPPDTVTVEVSAVYPSGSGTTSPSAGFYQVVENSTFSITATPSPGYAFDYWEVDGANAGTANPYSFDVGTSDHLVSALFKAIPTVAVTVAAVSPLGGGMTDPVEGLYRVAENAMFQVSAVPSADYTFDYWELDGTNVGSTNPYSFDVGTSDHSIGAFFKAIPKVTVTVNAVSPLDSGTTNPAEGSYQIAENSVFQISATPFPGYTFDHWELDGANVGSVNPYSFNVGTSSHEITAHFARVVSMQIDSADSLAGWWSRGSTLGIDNSDVKEGAGAVVVTATSPPDWNIYAVDERRVSLVGYSALQIWIKASDATRRLELMVATDWSNYNVYTITGLTSNTWTLVSIDLSTPTTRVGTIDFSSITFIRFGYEIKRTSASLKIDDIKAVI